MMKPPIVLEFIGFYNMSPKEQSLITACFSIITHPLYETTTRSPVGIRTILEGAIRWAFFFLQRHNENGDSKQCYCQPSLSITLLSFTQNSTCDSWKGFPGQLSARAPDNTAKWADTLLTRGPTCRHKDVREGGDLGWTVLWTKLCARLFCCARCYCFYPPSHPPCLWVGVLREQSSLLVLDACLWPRAMTGNRGGSRIPTTALATEAGSEIIGQQEVGMANGSGQLIRRSADVCLCRCVWTFLRSWHRDCEHPARLPPYVHSSLGLLASSTNKLKSIAGYLSGRYRRYQRNK